MGKAAKSSRKGKKAWRANIKTDDIDEFFEKATKDALSGSSNLDAIPSDSLFYVDKSTDIPIKRKIEKHRERVLRHESLLQKNAFVKPVPSSILKKCKKRKKVTPKSETVSQNTPNDEERSSDFYDIWNVKGEANVKATKKSNSIIPAIEVDPPGCSFNPPFEAHQDALAQAVADEMQKVYRKELAPQPLPHVVPDEGLDEDCKIFMDVNDGDECDSGDDLGNDGAELLEVRKQREKRITRVEQNRRARRKEQLKAEAEAKKLEKLSKEIDSLPDIMKEIEQENEEQERRHLRRLAAKQERRKAGPPRLGKHKFKPAPLQVLLTDQIRSGSLRKLDACPTLIRDRYKSLEKRGLIVPRAK